MMTPPIPNYFVVVVEKRRECVSELLRQKFLKVLRFRRFAEKPMRFEIWRRKEGVDAI